MKPKTEIQNRVVRLSESLPKLSTEQLSWAQEKCFQKWAHKRKSTYLCMECGVIFPIGGITQYAKPKVVSCPHCDNLLKIVESKKRTSSESQYFSIFTVAEEFQVLRHFCIEKLCKAGRSAEYRFIEAVQNWINAEGEVFNMSRTTAASSFYYDAWTWGSKLELRGWSYKSQKFNIFSIFIYPEQKFIPRLRRNGFKRGLHNISPYVLFPALLKNSMAETLMKAKQYSLLKYMLIVSDIQRAWPSIKICLRNNYLVKDASIWLDYLDLLEYFGKDLRNAKYVCPENMMKEHDKLSAKKHEVLKKKRLVDQKLKAIKDEEDFKKLKGKYLGISFSDELIKVIVLDSVHEYIKEGELLHHCVFSSEYYKHEDTLILSARIDDAPIETIEISLETFSIIQSRGLQNQNSKYHDQILKLVNENIHLFKRSSKQFVKQHMAVAI